jgi:hypothetical protein
MSGSQVSATGLFHTQSEIEELVRGFRDGSWPRGQWTHRAHLVVGLWFLTHYPLAEATEQIRAGIQNYNAAHGVKVSATTGYHETFTRFYIWAIHRFIQHADLSRSTAEVIEALVSEVGDQEFPFRYYSRERMLSWEARLGWVEPDLSRLEE